MNSPAQALAALIERSGLTLTEVSKRAGYRHTSGLHHYTNGSRGDEKPIPESVIKKLIPILVGRGRPVVTPEDVVALGQQRAFLALTKAPNHAVVRDLAKPNFSGPSLIVKYQVEDGVYVTEESLARRAGYPGPLMASPEWGEQWLVKIISDVAESEFRAGDILHCVPTEEMPAIRLAGRRCVISVTSEGGRLVSIRLSRIDGEGKAALDAGTVLGVVIGVYSLI